MLNGCTGKCVRLSRPLVGFWTHFKSLNFQFFIHSFHSALIRLRCGVPAVLTPTINGRINLLNYLLVTSVSGVNDLRVCSDRVTSTFASLRLPWLKANLTDAAAAAVRCLDIIYQRIWHDIDCRGPVCSTSHNTQGVGQKLSHIHAVYRLAKHRRA